MLLRLLWICVLTAALASLAAMALLGARRSRRLARRAHEMGLRFSPDDLFDAPRRYAPFALMRAGHSCRAHNVIYGRREGLPVRAFDFHYEIGHGPVRSTRRYWCVVVETDRDLCRLILWNHMDRQTAPTEATGADQEYGQWALRGSAQDAVAVAPLMKALAGQGASCQSCGQVFMMCLPAHSKLLAEASQFEIAVAMARALCTRSEAQTCA